jgi:hypothetical protein
LFLENKKLFIIFSTFTIADNPIVDDQQVGCIWEGDYLVSLSLSGALNYLDANQTSKPIKVVKVRCYFFFIFY